jgi:hypothetical protein
VSRRRSPFRGRVGGAVLFVLGAGIGAVTVARASSGAWFSSRAMVVAPLCLLLGLWLLIVGEPIDPVTGEGARWGKIGQGVSAAIGLLIGLVFLLLQDSR